MIGAGSPGAIALDRQRQGRARQGRQTGKPVRIGATIGRVSACLDLLLKGGCAGSWLDNRAGYVCLIGGITLR